MQLSRLSLSFTSYQGPISIHCALLKFALFCPFVGWLACMYVHFVVLSRFQMVSRFFEQANLIWFHDSDIFWLKIVVPSGIISISHEKHLLSQASGPCKLDIHGQTRGSQRVRLYEGFKGGPGRSCTRTLRRPFGNDLKSFIYENAWGWWWSLRVFYRWYSYLLFMII